MLRKLVTRAGEEAKLGFPIHPHMLRHACGFKLANAGHDTRAIQHYMGHKNIQHTVRYTELAPDLTKSIEKLSPVEFTTKVFHQYSMPVGDRTDMTNAIMAEVQKDAQRDSGELERMPQWKSNPLVRAHVLNIYGYLKARHDGVIGPERPELMPTQD